MRRSVEPAALGEHFDRWIAHCRERLGRLGKVLLPYRSYRTRLSLLVNLAVGGLMLLVLSSNTAKLTQLKLDNPWTFTWLTSALLFNQQWSMFAPEPGRTTQWLFVQGVLADGGLVDAYADRFTPPRLRKPADGVGHFEGYR